MNELKDAAKAGGRNMTVFGVITIVLGILAMLAPGFTGLSVAMMVGWLVVIAGAVRIFWAFRADSLGKGALVFVIGGLTLLCGLALVTHPLFASGILTLILAAYFFVDGISEIVAAFQARPADGWGWLLFAGIVSVLLGLMIWRQYPLAGAWAIGVLIGIKLFFIGLIMITTGSTVRSLAKG